MRTRRRWLADQRFWTLTFWVLLPLVGCVGDEVGDQGDNDRLEMEISDIEFESNGTKVTATGFLIEDSGVVYLAEALAESFPPQPGGATVEVSAMEDDALVGAMVQGPMRWLDDPVTVQGVVLDGKLSEMTIVEDD